MPRSRISEEFPHGPLHAMLAMAVLVTIYPVLWVFSIAFSGKQSLAIADLPPTPTAGDRLRAVVPWPEKLSVSNFTSVMSDQPFARWMLNGYFDTIPKELEEAAVIEGASAGKIFWRIVLPLAKPAVAITALFSFMTAWNEFILAATFMDKENMYTAPVGLRFFVGGFSQQWGYFAAGSIIVSIPVVLLFLYLQKYLVSGLTAGGVKG